MDLGSNLHQEKPPKVKLTIAAAETSKEKKSVPEAPTEPAPRGPPSFNLFPGNLSKSKRVAEGSGGFSLRSQLGPRVQARPPKHPQNTIWQIFQAGLLARQRLLGLCCTLHRALAKFRV